MKSPDERQQAGRHAERNRVGQRIQLLAKVAAVLVMRAMRPSSESNGMAKKNGDGRPVQVGLRVACADAP